MKEEEISRSCNERTVISSPSHSNLVLADCITQAASHVGGSERLIGAWGALRSLQFDEPFCWPTMISRISVSPSKMLEMLEDNVWLTGVVRLWKYLDVPLSVSRSTHNALELELPCYSLINIFIV